MLIKLKNKIESEVSKIGNIKLGEFGIHFSEQPLYFLEGISIIEVRRCITFDSRNAIYPTSKER